MAKDIQLENNDLLIKNGDFVVGESNAQHIQHIMEANPGDFRENPLLYGSIDLYRNAPESALRSFENHMRSMLKVDGFQVRVFELTKTDEGVFNLNTDAGII